MFGNYFVFPNHINETVQKENETLYYSKKNYILIFYFLLLFTNDYCIIINEG